MEESRIDPALLGALYRFAWALSGEESTAAALTQQVLAGEVAARSADGSRSMDVAIFSAAYQLFTRGALLPVPPPHERTAAIGKHSLQHAGGLDSQSLLKSFRELELPQRAALVLFYTTACSLHEIAAVLARSSEETVAIISRGKAEWLHILESSGESGGELSQGGAP